MNLLVFGATGKTGRAVVEQGSAAGHAVTAFVHDSSAGQDWKNVRVLTGDASNRHDVDAAMQGQDAVIDTIGGKTPYKDTDLESSAAGTIIASMQAHGVRRLLVTSMLGVGESKENAPFYERLLAATFLRGADKDKTALESAVEASDLEWTILRPAILTDDPPLGNVQVIAEGTNEKAHKITRADVAAFLIQQLASDAYLRQAVVIANS